jgi:predicted ATPase
LKIKDEKQKECLMISKIIIENYKSIQFLEIELKALNILIGANGAGKSNFISFFELLNRIYFQDLQTYIAENNGAENILYYGSKVSDYLLSRIIFDNTNHYTFKLKPDIANSLYFVFEKDGFNKNFEKPDSGPDWSVEELKGGKKESVLKDGNSRRLSYIKSYFNSYKVFHFHDTSNTAKVKKNCRIDDNSYLREDAGNLAAYLYLLQNRNPDSYKIIVNIIKSVAPYFKDFDLKPLELSPDYIKLEWREVGSDKYFDASNLSDGTLRFICIATLLLQPKLPKTIIIDEPELGLHPFAIGKLAGLIKSASKNSQIIISTQSVNLIENFNIEDIVVVNREKKQSTFNRLDEDSLKEWLNEYTIGELWDKNIIGGRP